MRWRVRPAETRDLEAVLQMERAMAELPHWAETEYARYISGGDAAAPRLLVVAELEAGGELAGFAAATSRPSPPGLVQLENLGVMPTARRRGMARALCQAVMRWGREQGAREMELEVRSGSAGALALYRSLRFQEAGRRRQYYRDPVDDAVLMSLREGEAEKG